MRELKKVYTVEFYYTQRQIVPMEKTFATKAEAEAARDKFESEQNEKNPRLYHFVMITKSYEWI